MSDRYLLLNNWIWTVFNGKENITLDELLEEFKKDLPLSMTSSLRKELELLESYRKAVKSV